MIDEKKKGVKMKVRYQKIEINGKNVKWNYTDQTLVEITQHDEEEKN